MNEEDIPENLRLSDREIRLAMVILDREKLEFDLKDYEHRINLMEIDGEEFKRKIIELNTNKDYINFYINRIEQLRDDDDDLTETLRSKGHH